MEYYHYFSSAIENEEYSKALSRWQEYVLGEPHAVELLAILDMINRHAMMADIFKNHAEKALRIWDQLDKNSEIAHKILLLIVDLRGPIGEDLQKFLRDYLTKRYQNTPFLDKKLALVGLSKKGQDAAKALSRFDLLCHLEKGNYVLHKGSWGVGKIINVSYPREEIECEFEFISQPQSIPFANCLKTLAIIKHGSFRADRYASPDTLWQSLKKEPVKGITRILEELGPLTAIELKNEIYDSVVLAEDWSSWWSKTRALLKKDTRIAAPASSDARGKFSIRSAELSHTDELEIALENAHHTPEITLSVILQFIKNYPKLLTEAVKIKLIRLLTDLKSSSALSMPQHIQRLFLIIDLKGNKNASEFESELAEKLQTLPNPTELIEQLQMQNHKRRTLLEFKRIRQDFPVIFQKLLFETRQNHLRDFLLDELLGGGFQTNFESAVKELFFHPEKAPEMIVWYFQKAMKDDKLPLSSSEDKVKFFETLLVLLSRIENLADYGDLTKKIHTLLFEKPFTILQIVLKMCSLEAAKEIILLSSKCRSLSEHEQKILYALAEVQHPSLAKQDMSSLFSNPNIFWCTSEGLGKLRGEIDQIGTKEMPEANKNLKIAKGYGDLKENHEYKSAREWIAQLQSRLAQLSHLEKIHQIISPNDIPLDKVGIGSVVDYTLPDGSGSGRLILLSSFEADSEKKIISYQAKIALELEGLKVGEKFTLQGKEYIITAIGSFFEL